MVSLAIAESRLGSPQGAVAQARGIARLESHPFRSQALQHIAAALGKEGHEAEAATVLGLAGSVPAGADRRN